MLQGALHGFLAWRLMFLLSYSKWLMEWRHHFETVLSRTRQGWAAIPTEVLGGRKAQKVVMGRDIDQSETDRGRQLM